MDGVTEWLLIGEQHTGAGCGTWLMEDINTGWVRIEAADVVFQLWQG